MKIFNKMMISWKNYQLGWKLFSKKTADKTTWNLLLLYSLVLPAAVQDHSQINVDVSVYLIYYYAN